MFLIFVNHICYVTLIYIWKWNDMQQALSMDYAIDNFVTRLIMLDLLDHRSLFEPTIPVFII